MKRNRNQPSLISAYGIAQRLKRSPQAVLDALARLGIQPAASLPAGTYYPLTAVRQVKAGMRKPNRPRTADA